VSINWTLDPDNLMYGFIARGYKPGGFNSRDFFFDPETVWHYESGWKSTSLLQGRLRTQFALFYNAYNDFQTDTIEPSTGEGGVYNIGSGTIKGVEAQVEGVFGQFAFDTGAAYVDSELDSIPIVNGRLLPPGTLGGQCEPGEPSNPPFCFDYTPYIITTGGGSNLYSPEWTFNVGAQYTFLLGDASFTPRVNYSHIGEQWVYLAYSPDRDLLDSRGLVSALLTLQIGAWDAWSFQAYGTKSYRGRVHHRHRNEPRVLRAAARIWPSCSCRILVHIERRVTFDCCFRIDSLFLLSLYLMGQLSVLEEQ
jgi:iron complex outermembrane receptor protein